MADFGCSSGTNALVAMQNIIEAINLKHRHEFPNHPPLNFHFFFNDQTNNDFNNLFQNLPAYQNYFAAGVPGSFHQRLFPKSFLHFGHSSYALHWLSMIPKAIMDKTSPAWNKGFIYCSDSIKHVREAYSAQFRADMNKFLNARAEEIVVGGLMVILISALSDGTLTSQTRFGKLHHILGSCLYEMAQLGEVDEEKVDSFNIPMYLTSEKELEQIIEANSYFSVERMNAFENPMLKQKKPTVEFLAGNIRALSEKLIIDHFENETLVDKIFQGFMRKLQDNYCIIDDTTHSSIDLFVMLKRTNNF